MRRSTVQRVTAKRYVALLRGINVGGRNKVAMADLREALEDGGYGAVRTYIQSGNVLFESAADARRWRTTSNDCWRTGSACPLVVVVRSHDQFRDVVEGARRFGAAPVTYHSDVIFLKPPLTAKQAMRVVEPPRRRRPGLAGYRRGVLRSAERRADEEPDEHDRRHAGVPADDDPQLGHDDEAPRPARREAHDLIVATPLLRDGTFDSGARGLPAGSVRSWPRACPGPHAQELIDNDLDRPGQHARRAGHRGPVAGARAGRWGLDYCCGGTRTLQQACAAQELDADAVIEELIAPVSSQGTDMDDAMDASSWSTTSRPPITATSGTSCHG